MPHRLLKRVLIAHPDPALRTLLRAVLPAPSLEVDEIASGNEPATRPLTDYDVVCASLQLARELSASLPSRESLFHGPVLLAVAEPDEEPGADQADERIHGVIRRPFDEREIAELIAACAEIRSSKGMNAMCAATMFAGAPLIAWLSKIKL